eukprot:2264216-Prymnesium_polylepis.1
MLLTRKQTNRCFVGDVRTWTDTRQNESPQSQPPASQPAHSRGSTATPLWWEGGKRQGDHGGVGGPVRSAEGRDCYE